MSIDSIQDVTAAFNGAYEWMQNASVQLGVALPPEAERLQEVQQWLLKRLRQYEDLLTKRQLVIDELTSQLVRQKEQINHHEIIPEGEETRAQKRTVARITRITGVKLPRDQWTNQTLEICHRMLEKLYVRDPITDILSHHSFVESLEETLDLRARIKDRGEKPKECTVVVCDLNRFKSYNEHLGHNNTDHILREIASVVRHRLFMFTKVYSEMWHKKIEELGDEATPDQIRALRDSILKIYPERETDKNAGNDSNKRTIQDICEKMIPFARMFTAGDEFAIQLPCELARAEVIMKEVNQDLYRRQLQFSGASPDDKNIGVRHSSMSYGFCEIGLEDNAEDILKEADNNMMEFKRRFKKDAEFRKKLLPGETDQDGMVSYPQFIPNPDYVPTQDPTQEERDRFDALTPATQGEDELVMEEQPQDTTQGQISFIPRERRTFKIPHTKPPSKG